MKALTIQQPWAWAIFHAGKDIENRTWFPRCLKPGETIAIHVSKTLASPWDEACNWIGYAADRIGADKRAVPAEVRGNHLAGYIVGLVDVMDWTSDNQSRWAFGSHHWRLENPRLVVPVPAVGKLGLWHVPEELQRGFDLQGMLP